MRKVLVSIAAVSAAFVAAPAAAQGFYSQGGFYAGQGGYMGQGYRGDRGLVRQFDAQINQLLQRIERSAQRGRLSPREYRSLHHYGVDARQRLFNYARNGLSHNEARDISARIDRLRFRIREERQDGRDRDYRGW
jgi:Spy/CpxP family protein refolding chaperone